MTATPATEKSQPPTTLPPALAVRVFILFACVYFLSTLTRAITATLAPELTQQFDLSASNLGFLAGSYFVGFALMQLPVGYLLDRFGPPRVAVSFLVIAIFGCAVLATAADFWGLVLGRFLLGIGLAAGMMAPLTAYRRWYSPGAQLRASSWMLMVGSFGMLSSTLPVQWLLPVIGWRGIFWGWAVLAVAALVGMALFMPKWPFTPAKKSTKPASGAEPSEGKAQGQTSAGFGQVLRNPRLISVAPLGFFCYGGMFAMLTLWVGPWMQHVAGANQGESAVGLFWINMVMLVAFFGLGLCGNWLAAKFPNIDRMALWLPLPGLVTLLLVVGFGHTMTWPIWALYCVSLAPMSLLPPKLAQTFAPELAGRALTAYNLMSFAGTFIVQWGVGLGIDLFLNAGMNTANAYRSAVLIFWVCCALSVGWFLRMRQTQPTAVVQ